MRAHDVRHRLARVRHLVDVGDEIEVLLHGEVLVEAELLRHVADLAADQRRLADDVEAEAGAAAAIGDEQAAQHADGRGLAAAVGAEKSADLARPRPARSSPSTTLRVPKLLRSPCTSMTRSVIVRPRGPPRLRRRDEAPSGRTAIGWPGLISRGLLRRRPRLHHVDELGADRLAVDHRRRVFGLRRDEGDGRGEVGRAVVADEPDLVADMDLGEPRLGHEEPHEDVLRRQQRHHRRRRRGSSRRGGRARRRRRRRPAP